MILKAFITRIYIADKLNIAQKEGDNTCRKEICALKQKMQSH